MKTITITIEGTTPLMICSFTDEAALAVDSPNPSTQGEKKEPKIEAENFLYRDSAGKPASIMPTSNLLACFRGGGSFFKIGRNKVTTQKSSLIPACVEVVAAFAEIESTHGWSIDSRAIRNPVTGGRRLRHRPLFNDWRMTFEVSLDTSLMTEKLLREIVDAAGKRCGLGAFRPSCNGPFGKFKVTKWAISEVVDLRAA